MHQAVGDASRIVTCMAPSPGQKESALHLAGSETNCRRDAVARRDVSVRLKHCAVF